MHILIAVHDYYPDPGSGGTGRYAAEVARRLIRRGHRVSVVTRRRGETPAREVIEGVDVHRFDLAIADRRVTQIMSDVPSAATTVTEHLRSLPAPPDIVSFQGPVSSLLVDRAVSASTPRIVTFHSPWSTEYGLKTQNGDGLRRRLNISLRRIIEGYVLSSADYLIALSKFMLGESRRVHGHDLPASVIPGGVDTETFTPYGQSEQIAGEPAFLTVRRLSQRMGHEVLLEAFSRVLRRHPQAHLHIAGDGPLRNSLEESARKLGIDTATTFHGFVPDDRLPRLYRSADVFVLPTIALEGFGLATLEALASGLPVLATPVGGTTEILDELAASSRLPVSPLAGGKRSSDLAKGMAEWADLSSMRLAMAGAVCRSFVRSRYRWDRTVHRFERVCRDQMDVDKEATTP